MIKFERTQIHFFSDVFTAVVVVVALSDFVSLILNRIIPVQRYLSMDHSDEQ